MKKNENTINAIMLLIKKELNQAMEKYNTQSSLHEGYAILLEEVDELWEIIKQKPSKIKEDEVIVESIQVAAMAIRLIHDYIIRTGGKI